MKRKQKPVSQCLAYVMLKYVCLKFASHSGQQQQQQEDSDVSILEIKPSGIGKEEGKEEGQSFGRYLRQSWG